MEAIFDHLAATYDSSFTNSHAGRMQRARVWKIIDPILSTQNTMRILELNCGTGEDALFFAEKGHDVIATDASGEMIRMAKEKQSDSTEGSTQFEALDFNATLEKYQNQQFDLIFSNFGGFNCVDEQELIEILNKANTLLKTGGRLIAVVMPRFCLQESLYFLFKGKLKESGRRSDPNGAITLLDGKEMTTYYHNPSVFTKLQGFRTEKIRPIGFFLPPSYLESFYQPKKVLMKTVYFFEKLTFPAMSRFADHYLIQLKKKV